MAISKHILVNAKFSLTAHYYYVHTYRNVEMWKAGSLSLITATGRSRFLRVVLEKAEVIVVPVDVHIVFI